MALSNLRHTLWITFKKEYPEYAMSGKTIYNYVFFHMKGGAEETGAERPTAWGEGESRRGKRERNGGKYRE
jgi:hypothetical protein